MDEKSLGLNLDRHREHRTGHAEAVYAEGKTPEQVAVATAQLVRDAEGAVFATRATRDQFEAVARLVPGATFDERSGLVVAQHREPEPGAGTVAIVSAGTSDLPIAEEAALTAEALGLEVDRVVDVGVAGVHRVLEHRDRLESAGVVIVVAGMEGALPSVVGGLTSRPIVAVPTSVGYGASFDGLAALLGMLTSCAPGITVVNIDNGFGAALAAHRILKVAAPAREQ